MNPRIKLNLSRDLLTSLLCQAEILKDTKDALYIRKSLI